MFDASTGCSSRSGGCLGEELLQVLVGGGNEVDGFLICLPYPELVVYFEAVPIEVCIRLGPDFQLIATLKFQSLFLVWQY